MEIKFNEEINYKELCQILNEDEVSGGTNREKQLARFNKKYEIEKVGRGKYIIKRERTTEEIKLNSDKHHYSKYLQAVLLNMIAENPNIEMILTYRQIRENLMMVNSKYFPFKYNKTSIQYNIPSTYDLTKNKAIDFLKKDWIEISDQHDRAAIKYALKCLKDKDLLTSLNETYLFYKFEKDNIYHMPQEATIQQLSEINQRQLDYIKENIPTNEIERIKQKVFKKEEEIANINQIGAIEINYNGYLVQSLYAHGREVAEGYYKIVDDYVKELGFDRYARAFKIVRPNKLKTVAGYFAPVFNEKQVERYLTNKRFSSMPIFFHNQTIEELIKIK